MSVTADPTLTVTRAEDGTGPLVEAGTNGVTLAGYLADYSVDVDPATRAAVAKHVDISDGADRPTTWWSVEFGPAEGRGAITITTDDLPGLHARLGALMSAAAEAAPL